MAEDVVMEVSDEKVSNGGNDVSQGLKAIEQEGLHMIHLRQALQKTIKKSVDSIRYSEFSKHYRFAHEASPKVLRSIMQQLKEQLHSSMMNELDLMITEEDLVPLFNELDQIINNTPREGEPAWRPSGDAGEDIQAHLYQQKLEEKEKLKKILEAAEEETARLKKLTKEKKEKLLKTQEKLEGQLKLFDLSSDTCEELMAEISSGIL